MRTVLVVGGSGFSGGRLLERAPADQRTFAIARSDAAIATIRALGSEPIAANAANADDFSRALDVAQPDVIITLSSLGLPWAPDMVRSVGASGAARLVFTSTTGIFTRLSPPSKLVRLDAEREAARLPSATVVRPTMIYGRPGDRNMERLLGRLRTIPVLPAPDAGRTLQQPVHVDDLVDCLWAVADEQPGREALNCPGPDPLMFRDIVQLAGKALNRRRRIVGIPAGLLLGPLAVAERGAGRSGKRLPISTEQIDRLREDKVFDSAEAMALVGRQFRSFENGITAEAGLLGYAP